MNRQCVASVLPLVAALLGAPAQAAVLFQDNFNNDNAVSYLNVTTPGQGTLLNWTVGNGSVDYVKNTNFGITCLGNTGACLDLDGSTGDGGRITSKTTFVLHAGVRYTLDAQLSGNQRGGASDALLFGLVNVADNSEIAALVSGIPAAQAFGALSYSFTAAADGTYRLFFQDQGADNVGLILDNVGFSDDTRGQVPEPASLMLVGLGLLAVGAARRRA